MTSSRSPELRRSEDRIGPRLASRAWRGGERPTFTRTPREFEVAHRDRAMSSGGIGVAHELAKQAWHCESIDRRVRVPRAHMPDHESAHVLNFACSALCGGRTIEDLELLRKNGASSAAPQDTLARHGRQA